MSPFELDRHVHRDLRRLPSPVAPADFTARVMAARHRLDTRPWYSKAWVTWPFEWKVASGAALVSFVVLLGMASPLVVNVVGAYLLGVVTEQAPSLRAAFVTVDAIWQVVVRPLVLLLLPVVLLMWAGCTACGVALT